MNFPEKAELNNLRAMRSNKRTESFCHRPDQVLNPLDSIRQAQRRVAPVPGSQLFSRRETDFNLGNRKKGLLERGIEQFKRTSKTKALQQQMTKEELEAQRKAD